MNLISRIRNRDDSGLEERAVQFLPTWPSGPNRSVRSFSAAVMQSPVVHAVVMARLKVFSEVDFVFRNRRTKREFGTGALSLLEQPWPGGTSTELLARLEMDASTAGNAYVRRTRSLLTGAEILQPLDPAKMEVRDNGREKIGYVFWPNGFNMGDGVSLTLGEVAHWAPIPHPDNPFIGVSWMQSVIDEILNDLRMTQHQTKFFTSAATPNMVVKIEGSLSPESRTLLRDELQHRFSGIQNAYKTMVLDQGADLQIVGRDFQQMDFINVQKSVEGRIASAGGVPPIIVSFRAGLDAATYSNYAMAMRAMADHTIRPAWNSVAAALAPVVDVPAGAELWYDDRHVAALRQDAKDEAEIKNRNALTLEALLRSGWTSESALAAVESGDLTGLEHTGLFSVQLQPPGTELEPMPDGTEGETEL